MSMNQPNVNPADIERVRQQVIASLRDHWKLFLAKGIILVILGVLAVAIPPLATFAVTLVLGWLFLFSGGVGLVTSFWMRALPGFWWSLLSAVLAIAAGIVLLTRPMAGVLTLTLILIAFFIAEGVASIMYGLEHRKSPNGRWTWMVVTGLVDLILAGMIIAGLPGTAAWAIGLIVGINMLFAGMSMIAMALHGRSEAAATTPATSQPRSA